MAHSEEPNAKCFVVVRPYGSSTRASAFSALSAAGLHLAPQGIIVPGTPDDEAVEAITHAAPDLLLVPYHPHLDYDDEWVNGFTFLTKLRETTVIPAFMPIRDDANKVEFEGAFGAFKSNTPNYAKAVFAVWEAELDTPETHEAFVKFVG